MRDSRAARLSTLSKWITGVILAIAAAIVILALSLGRMLESTLGFGILAAMLLTGLFSVRGYAVGSDHLIIKRPLWNTRIGLSDLVEASLMPELATQFSISLFSTRGFFGMIGFAHKKDLGVFRMYITDPSKAVLLRFSSKKPIVISPESPEDFLDALISEGKSESRVGMRWGKPVPGGEP
jgi:hypothetical protein